MITVITLNGQSVNLVSLPAAGSGAANAAEFTMRDTVALVSSPYTGQTQAQAWPGADLWGATLTLAPMAQADAAEWIAALMEMRGMLNPVQIVDPMQRLPRGYPAGAPVVDGSAGDIAGATVLHTAGWAASTFGLLLPGDYLQVGYRLHRVTSQVNSDASGKAAISVWPSLREAPAANAPLVLNNCAGLFRLATNKRGWSADVKRLSRISLPLMEYR